MEADYKVVTLSGSIAATISFSQEWSDSRTITMSFDVPAGKKSFNYHGFMMAQILVFNDKDQTYRWKDKEARCLSNILVSRPNPVNMQV